MFQHSINIYSNTRPPQASRRKRGSDYDIDAEYDGHYGTSDRPQKQLRRYKEEALITKATHRHASQTQRLQTIYDTCPLCMSSRTFPNHLLIALGQYATLILPERGRLGPGHCRIVPLEHVGSSRMVDDHVWDEMRNFKKCLVKMHM